MIEWIDAGNETTVENCVALIDVLHRFRRIPDTNTVVDILHSLMAVVFRLLRV